MCFFEFGYRGWVPLCNGYVRRIIEGGGGWCYHEFHFELRVRNDVKVGSVFFFGQKVRLVCVRCHNLLGHPM